MKKDIEGWYTIELPKKEGVDYAMVTFISLMAAIVLPAFIGLWV